MARNSLLLEVVLLVPVGAATSVSPFALDRLEPIHANERLCLHLFYFWTTSLLNVISRVQNLLNLSVDPIGFGSLCLANNCDLDLDLSFCILHSDIEESYVLLGLLVVIVHLGIDASG